MSERSNIWLWERAVRRLIEAELIDGLDHEDIIKAAASWKPAIDLRIQELNLQRIPRDLRPQHLHWDWARKTNYYAGLAFDTLGIECEDEVQGLMIVDTVGHNCQIPLQVGKPLVYIMYLATAPWNDPDFTGQPRYGGVGKVFLAAAVQLSIDNGYAGRIGLHSLPQAEGFYTGCGMTDLGPDTTPSAQNLRYYEMTAEQAQAFRMRGLK